MNEPLTKIKKKNPAVSPAETSQKPEDVRYTLNEEFECIAELRDLVLKSSPAEKTGIIRRLNNLGHVKVAIISGIFMNKDEMPTDSIDLLVVGDDLSKRKFQLFIRALEAEVGTELRFALMEKDEFLYRLGMFDRFIRLILDRPHEKLINVLAIEGI